MAASGNVVVERVTTTTRDGVELVASLYRPVSATRLPTILERTPYDRARLDLDLMGRFFAARGYAVMIQDCRGRHESGGDFGFYFSPEGEDGYDTVDWIARQSWSDGSVGTTGISFGGAIQQALAVTRPPALSTQVVLDAGFNYWARMARQSGAFNRGVNFPYALWMAMTGHEAAANPEVRAALAAAIEDVGSWISRPSLRRGATPLALAPTYEDWYFEIAERVEYDEVWRNPLASLEDHIDEYPDIPVCFVSSWYGHHADGNVRKFLALRQRLASTVKLVIGPWQHGLEYGRSSVAGEIDLGTAAAIDLNELRLRWFERFLKRDPEAEGSGPDVEVFVMGGGGGGRTPEGRLMHGGRWITADEWPPEGGESGDLYLHADGSLRLGPEARQEAATTYTFDPRDPVPTIGGGFQDPLGGERAVMFGGGFDQRGRPELPLCRDRLPLSSRDDVLVFRTAPLQSDVELVGAVRCHLWVATSAPDTDFTAKLIDEYPPSAEYPDGFALNLVDAIVRLRFRNGTPVAREVTPHRPYELELELPPVANRFLAGHSIRLDVSSSNAPHFDVNPNTGEAPADARGARTARNTVFHDIQRPSRLTLRLARDASNLRGALTQ